MRFEASRLRPAEWIVGAGSLVLLASMLLLPWYGITAVSPPPGPKYFVVTSIDGWHGATHLHWLLLVTVLAAITLVLLQATRRAPALPATFSWLTMVLGGLSVLWLIYRVLIDPPGGRQLGGWIGLLGACAIAYGGYRSLRVEGIATADAPQDVPTVDPWAQAGS